jgi:serine protease Do
MREKKGGLVFLSMLVMLFIIPEAYALHLSPKELYQKISPGVVFIYAAQSSEGGSAGTGSIISKDGLVITNAHIFTQEGSSRLVTNIQIFLKPDKITGNPRVDLTRRYKGEIMAYDIPLDLALLKIIDFDAVINPVDFGNSEKVEVGDQAYAIGHPEQGGLWSLTTGVISAFKADYAGVTGKDLFQTEASINRGNSGGPLLNEEGLMIGINSLIARQAADGLTITDVNFSIRSNVAIKWLNSLGYQVAAITPISGIPEKSESEMKAEPPAEKEPIQPEEEPLSPEPKVVEPTPHPVEETPKPEKPVPTPPEKEKKGKILTEENPYDMDELVAGMREMEDMMDEMRGRINQFKKRR